MGVVNSKTGKRVNLKSKVEDPKQNSSVYNKKQLKIVLVGLENSGKTSVLHYLRHKTAPTVGFILISSIFIQKRLRTLKSTVFFHFSTRANPCFQQTNLRSQQTNLKSNDNSLGHIRQCTLTRKFLEIAYL